MPVWFSRGYTGHEHLREFDLINMNGRMYDPTMGRMLAPDNFVQDPYNTQSYNRYAYVFNSPLSYTDPSGEIAGWIVSLISTAASYLINAGINQSWNPNEWSSGMVGFGGGFGGGGGYLIGGGNIGGNYSVMAGGGFNGGSYQYGYQAGPGLASTSMVQPAGTVNINMNLVNSRANWRPMHMGGPSNQDYIAWLTDDSDMSGTTAGGGVGDLPRDYPVLFRDFGSGLADGFGAGVRGTGAFIRSLGSAEGWRNLGEGVVNMGLMSCLTCADGIMMRAQMTATAVVYTRNIPNMSAYQIGYDLGFGAEKLAEAALFSKGARFGINTARFGLGGAMWRTSTFGPRSVFFGRYHSQHVPFGTRGIFNTGMNTGIGWSNHGANHVFRAKINGRKFLQIYK